MACKQYDKTQENNNFKHKGNTMSGHGGFIPVGNNMPINTINTGNIGGIQQPEEVNPQPVNDGGEEPLVAAQ